MCRVARDDKQRANGNLKLTSTLRRRRISKRCFFKLLLLFVCRIGNVYPPPTEYNNNDDGKKYRFLKNLHINFFFVVSIFNACYITLSRILYTVYRTLC